MGARKRRVTGGAAEAAPAADAVREVELRRFEAMVRGDLDALAPVLGDDLTYTHSNGEQQTKKELLDSLRTGELRYVSFVPADVQVRAYRDAAVVTGRGEMQVRSAGRLLGFTIRYTDLYLRREGRWQMVAWQSTRLPGA